MLLKKNKKALPNRIILEDCEFITKKINLETLKGKKILLTGSNGLFGRYFSYLVYYLNKERKFNCTLYCISLHGPNKDIRRLQRLDKCIIPIKKDLSKAFTWEHSVDYILHAAGYGQPKKFIEHSLETIKLNVNATWQLLEIAKKNSAIFLFFSSAEVYGNIPQSMIPVPETYNGNSSTTGVRAIYAESKRLGETVCSIFRRDFNFPVYIARISHTYGPGISKHDTRVLGDILRKAMDKKIIDLLDDGSSIKTFGYIADMVLMLTTIFLHGKDMIYNVGGTDTVSIYELATKVGAFFKAPVVLPTEKQTIRHIGNDPAIVKLNLTKYRREFGAISFTSFNKGLQRMLDWNKIETD